LIAACGPSEPKTEPRAASATAKERAEERSSTPARRIASQTILSDEILLSLGADVQGRVVAVSPLVDDPRYSTVAERWPAAIPRLPGSSEGLLALQPDLVLIASFTAPETRTFLEAQGVQMLRLEGFTGFDDYWRHTRTIAAAVGAEENAEEIIRQQKTRLDHLARRVADAPTIAAVSWGDGFVAGAETTFADISTYAGLDNLAARHGLVGVVQLSVEELVSWDPPMIVIACEPPRCADAEADLARQPGIAATKAARERRIIGIPSAYLSSTGAGMITAAELLGERVAGGGVE